MEHGNALFCNIWIDFSRDSRVGTNGFFRGWGGSLFNKFLIPSESFSFADLAYIVYCMNWTILYFCGLLSV